jgi:molybdenum cofactor cytidylyltransferase
VESCEPSASPKKRLFTIFSVSKRAKFVKQHRMVGIPFRLMAVLLAAGASSRMGRPKMLLPWGNKTILDHSIQAWKSVADDSSVIYSSGDDAIQAELDRIQFRPGSRVANPDPSRGMFSSIQTAARWTGWPDGVTHWAIVLGDQPHVPVATLRSLVQFAREFPRFICQPGRAGRPRHPVVIPREFFLALRNCAETTLKDFLNAYATARRFLEIDDPALEIDLDRPEDYERALRAFPPET